MAIFTFKSALGAVLAISTLSLSVPSFAKDYSVDINKTEIVYLPAPAAAVVVGNPTIADVSVHSPDTLFLVGRGYGETNLLVLDAQGQTLMNANITVSQGFKSGNVRVFKVGAGRETYNCTPNCQPAPVLGDAPRFSGSFKGKSKPINNTTALGTLSSPVRENIQFTQPMTVIPQNIPPNMIPQSAEPQISPAELARIKKRRNM